MGLLDFIEQHHLIRPAAHSFSQNAAFIIADIARRRADEPRHCVLLHELAHVDAHQCLIVIEQKACERFSQFSLADTGWPEEQETAKRAVGVLQASTCTAHRLRDALDRFGLADHTLAENFFHLEQLLTLPFHHLVDRNSGPAADN